MKEPSPSPESAKLFFWRASNIVLWRLYLSMSSYHHNDLAIKILWVLVHPKMDVKQLLFLCTMTSRVPFFIQDNSESLQLSSCLMKAQYDYVNLVYIDTRNDLKTSFEEKNNYLALKHYIDKFYYLSFDQSVCRSLLTNRLFKALLNA